MSDPDLHSAFTSLDEELAASRVPRVPVRSLQARAARRRARRYGAAGASVVALAAGALLVPHDQDASRTLAPPYAGTPTATAGRSPNSGDEPGATAVAALPQPSTLGAVIGERDWVKLAIGDRGLPPNCATEPHAAIARWKRATYARKPNHAPAAVVAVSVAEDETTARHAAQAIIDAASRCEAAASADGDDWRLRISPPTAVGVTGAADGATVVEVILRGRRTQYQRIVVVRVGRTVAAATVYSLKPLPQLDNGKLALTLADPLQG